MLLLQAANLFRQTACVKCQNLPNIDNEMIVINKNPVLFMCVPNGHTLKTVHLCDITLINSSPNPQASSSQ